MLRRENGVATAWRLAFCILMLAGAALLVQASFAASKSGSGDMKTPEVRDTATLISPDKGVSGIAPSLIMTNNWTNVFPNLLTVSAVSSTEAWAAGEYGHLIHYVSGSWTRADPPLMQGEDLLDISMASPSSGWIAAGTSAFEYDGTNWKEHSIGLGSDLLLKRISALDANEAWGITLGPNCGDYSQIVHWDGLRWSPVLPPNSPYNLNDLEMVSSDEGWAVGLSCSPREAILLHYVGTTWLPIAGPTNPAPGYFYSLSVTGQDDLWSIGTPYYGTRRAVYHYNAGTWTSWLLPTTVPWSITMANDNEGWLTSSEGIWHWNGQAWSRSRFGQYFVDLSYAGGRAWAVGLADLVMSESVPGPWYQQWGGPTQQQLNSVSVLNTDSAWAVGNAGTVLQYSAGTWQRVKTTTNADLYDIQMLSPTDGYAVGGTTETGGIITHWDGVGWRTVLTTSTVLRSIDMLTAQEGWVVGDRTVLWHKLGDSWIRVGIRSIFPLYTNLDTVAMDSPTHAWAGGYNVECVCRVLVEYTGGRWLDRSPSLPTNWPPLRDFALIKGEGQGWSVGGSLFSPGTVLHLNSGVWTEDTETPRAVYSVALDGDGAWAVGYFGSAYRNTGGSWQPVALPIGYGLATLYKVRMLAGSIGWAVGEHGTILRYTPPAASSVTR